VMPCQGEKFVVYEYLVYQLYNAVKAKSFRARLVKVILEDSNSKGKSRGPMYGILLEEEEQMAKRNQAVLVEDKIISPEQTNKEHFLKLAVFQFMIGNTDWSVQYRQNIKLITTNESPQAITVPYDFDHSGIVAVPYAKPAQELNLISVKERRYRGYCVNDMSVFDDVITHYNSIKPALYDVYTKRNDLDVSYVKSTSRYLDEFYKTINDPAKLKTAFQYPCRSYGTGNVVIKGLKN